MRKILGDNILVYTGPDNSEYNGVFTVDDIGVFILSCLEKAGDESDIAKMIIEEFDTDFDTALKDTAEFISQLRKYGFIDE